MRRPILTLTLLAGLTFFLGLGIQAITDSDEAFYAEAAREMVEGGDWLTPHFNYQERWQKPVLYYWVAGAAFAGTDSTEFMARLGSASSGLGLVLLTFAAARRLTGRADGAWMAGAIAATCYGYFVMARSALPDLPLAFFITATIWCAMCATDPADRKRLQWAALAGLAAGLGFLDKGPLALIIPAIVLLPIWWRERRRSAAPTRPTIRVAHVAAAATLFAIAGLPWYIAMYATHGAAYLQSFFVSDNLERFATTRYNDARMIWYYVPIIIGGLIPWAVFLLVLPWRTVRGIVRRRTLGDVEWRLAMWTFAPFVLFTASIGKQPRYILPLLPPIAMMLGTAIANRIAVARDDMASRRELTIATLLTAIIFFAGTAFLLFRARVLFVSAFPAVTWLGIAALACAAIALAAVAATNAWHRLPATMAASSAALLLTLQFGALAGQRPEAVEQVATLLRLNRLGGEPIGVYQAFVRNLVFYTRIHDVEVVDDASALTFLGANERVFLVLNRRDLDRLKTLTTLPLNTVGEVTYLNAAAVRLRTLLAPLPAEDLDTVVVISNR